ncbi:MAG TPA: DUF4124 domain-containing protein [Methylomirabilota bacterium]|nr:DUF4124 domain-containing protein [Methylomirabilota bacterium]
MTRAFWWLGCVAVLGLLVSGAGAQAIKGYRWVDDQGNVHYAARRDQVPERYRDQLGPVKPGEPPKPVLTPSPTGRAGTPRGCVLRLRGNERLRGSSYSYANCDLCREALHALGESDLKRAECFASSLEDELGKRRR